MTACPRCGEANLPERSHFCLACGGALAWEPPAPGADYTPPHLARDAFTSAVASEGERKDVSILFVDVADSSSISRTLDPEEVHAVVDGFFGLALAAVHAERGLINQFRGDGFMALFGAPRAAENHAVHALRAALQIRQAVGDYANEIRRRYGLAFELRFGVHSGLVWVGRIGAAERHDYTAEGAAVVLAARLEADARPGQILLSAETASRARDYFELRDLGLRPLRGLGEEVEVYELLGSRELEGRLDVERARGWTPFRGRTAELRWLDETLPAQPGAPAGLVEIRGEPGIGKSRLALEHLRRRHARCEILETRCWESARTRAFAPWRRLLGRWPAQLAGGKRAQTLERELDAGRDLVREDAARALAELLTTAAEPRPLIVLIDDLQWIDPSSRFVLEHLISSSGACGFTLLATAREESDSRWPQPLRVQTLELGPLAPEDRAPLARGILTGLPRAERLVELAVQRGAGNPLFIEEVARALRDGGEQLRRAARLEVALERLPSRVPRTLAGTIAARIDALSDGCRRLLQAAAVIGVPFDLALLREVCEPGEVSERDGVSLVVERGLLYRTEEGEFDFHHALVRDTTYDQILHTRRRELHRRCAEALERREPAPGPEAASRIGWHYDGAGSAEAAARYLAGAGRAYFKLGAAPEAATHLGRAWELHQTVLEPDHASRANVGLALASALNALDRASEAADVLDALDGEALESGDRSRLARVCIENGWVQFSERNRVEEGRRWIRRGIELSAHDAEALAIAATGHAYLSRLEANDGQIALAEQHGRTLIGLADRIESDALRIHGQSTVGYALCDRGDLAQARTLCRAALAAAERLSNDLLVAMAASCLCKVLTFGGEVEEALETAERAIETGTRTRQLGSVHIAHAWAAHAWLLRGDAETAFEQFEQSAALGRSWPSSRYALARGLLEVGRHDEAAEQAHECLALEPPALIRIRALWTLGLALGLAEAGNLECADESIQEGLALARRLELPPHVGEALQARGRLHRTHGDPETGARLLAASAARFEECGMPLHARQSRAFAGG